VKFCLSEKIPCEMWMSFCECVLNSVVTWVYNLHWKQWVVVVSDVVEKTSTRRRSRIPCVVMEKMSTWRRRRRLRKKWRKSTNFQPKIRVIYITAITHTEILVARCMFLIKSDVFPPSADLFPIGLCKTNKQFNNKTKLWKQNGWCLDDVTTALSPSPCRKLKKN